MKRKGTLESSERGGFWQCKCQPPHSEKLKGIESRKSFKAGKSRQIEILVAPLEIHAQNQQKVEHGLHLVLLFFSILQVPVDSPQGVQLARKNICTGCVKFDPSLQVEALDQHFFGVAQKFRKEVVLESVEVKAVNCQLEEIVDHLLHSNHAFPAV